MSRKREEQRENKRELARQLGVSGKDVPTTLLENERVTEPRILPSVSLQSVKRGFLAKAGPATLHVALFVVDGSGPRLVRQLQRSATLSKPGEIALAATDVRDEGDDVVRYRRPGHFVVVALLTEAQPKGVDAAAASRALAKQHALALGDPKTLRVVLDGKGHAIDDDVIRRCDPARGCVVDVAGAESLSFVASAVLGIAAVHRVNETVMLPLSTSDGKLTATLSVAVRL